MRRFPNSLVAPSSLAALALSCALVPGAHAQDASIDPLGGGTPGFGGVPRIDLDGAPIVGLPLRLGIEDGLPNAVAVLAASAGGAPVPSLATGGVTHLLPPFFAFGVFVLDGEGRGGPIVSSPALMPSTAGASFFVQGAVFDPAAQGSLALTEGLRFDVGTVPGGVVDVEDLFSGDSASGGVVMDVDADGNLDVLSAITGLAVLRTFAGDGTGALQASVDFPTAPLPNHLISADFDGDAVADVVVFHGNGPFGGGGFSVHLGLPGGGIGPAATTSENEFTLHAVLDDFDADGDLDLARVQWPDQPGQSILLSLRFGDGVGGFGPAIQRPLPPSTSVAELDAADLDLDSRAEMLVALGTGGGLLVMPITAAGAFGTPSIVASGTDAFDVVAGDFDSDGNPDVAVWNGFSTGVTVYSGNGTGALTPAQSLAWPNRGPELALDVNGDSILDLVGLETPAPFDYRIATALGTGTGTFAPVTTSASTGDLGELLAGDVDADGNPDIVIAQELVGAPSALLGIGGGAFVSASPDMRLALDEPLLSLTRQSVVLADLDRDGIDDILDATEASLEFRAGLGGGVFAAPVSTPIAVAPIVFGGVGGYSYELGDVNGDGLLDAVFLHRPGPGFGGETLNVGLGDGAGGFTFLPVTPLAAIARATELIDLDGDGVLDLVLSAPNDLDEVSIVFGQGNGTFGAPQSFPVGPMPASMAIGDLDLDGDLDIVTGNATSITSGSPDPSDPGSLSVLLNDGVGGFAPQQLTSLGFRPSDIELGDLDGDGTLDLVAYDWTGISTPEAIVALLGDGSGGFGAPTAFATSVESGFRLDLALGDLDGDGVLDAITHDFLNSRLEVFNGVGDGTFGQPVSVGTYFGALIGLQLVDVDGDRVPDVVGKQLSSSGGVVARAIVIMRNLLAQ